MPAPLFTEEFGTTWHLSEVRLRRVLFALLVLVQSPASAGFQWLSRRSTVLALLPWGSFAALSVLPHQLDSLVMQLRETITLDDKDLLGPLPPSACSSLSDGPFCTGLAGDLLSGSTQFVVGGVLSDWVQAQKREAKGWSADSVRLFSNLEEVLREMHLQGKEATPSTPTARTGSQCFRLAFNRLTPGLQHLPGDYSEGLPQAIAASWEGTWEIEAGRHSSSPYATRVVLRSALGYLRFAQPVVLKHLLVGVPSFSANTNWGRGSLVCGRRSGQEEWCTALDQAVASAQRMGESHSDLGNSIQAVDEVAFIAAPVDGLVIGLVEVAATLPSHPLHALPSHRQVVLLRPVQGGRGIVEPELTSVSKDAVLWDVNEVLRHHMKLRVGIGSGAEKDKDTRRPKPKVQRELRSFQDMLRSLKAGELLPPPGVTFKRIKQEVAALVASTREIKDEDVLLHSSSESLLQQRLREKRLDGLLALQANWRMTMAADPHQSEASDASTEEERRWEDRASEVQERSAADMQGRGQGQGVQSQVIHVDGRRVELRLGSGIQTLQELVKKIQVHKKGQASLDVGTLKETVQEALRQAGQLKEDGQVQEEGEEVAGV